MTQEAATEAWKIHCPFVLGPGFLGLGVLVDGTDRARILVYRVITMLFHVAGLLIEPLDP